MGYNSITDPSVTFSFFCNVSLPSQRQGRWNVTFIVSVQVEMPKLLLWGGLQSKLELKVLFGRTVLAQNGTLTGSLMVKATTSIYLLV